ncbi:hypothetical protein MSR1_13450 [Magnetospirillum gryphiswaldense MSR-1]|nr:hypothetical protein MSR1_13450 [Magnetospirillum gryphiswaldense MSR-1]AVM77740.1 hypothetical protein MSR1L_13450 [Magnetospirillum gryphiswaldense]
MKLKLALPSSAAALFIAWAVFSLGAFAWFGYNSALDALICAVPK